MIAAGHFAIAANAAAVEPTRPSAKWFNPIAPMHTTAADRDASTNARVGRLLTISTSILTGFSVEATDGARCSGDGIARDSPKVSAPRRSVSRGQLAWAVRLAVATGAELLLLPVYEPPGAASFGSYIASPGLYDEIEHALALEGEAEHLVAVAREAGARATARVVRGFPHSGIIESAAASDADLIVIGTHGRSGFFRFFLGSVAQKVIAEAPCPVMTVGPAQELKRVARKAARRDL
jgi:nucleotide-binding universal stress UspA family protein